MNKPLHFQYVWAAGGLFLLALLFLPATALRLGSGTVTGLVLCLFFLFSLLLLRHEGIHGASLLPAFFPLALAFFLRVFLLDYQSQDYQIFLSQWAAFFREHGGFSALNLPVGNYNVPYLYFLAALSYLPLPDLYGIKLFSIFFDILLAWGGLRLVRHFKPKGNASLFAFCAILLLPTVVLNGACWGQCDSIYAALLLHALASALDRRPAASVLLVAAAFSFKLQAIFLVPLWCAFWFTGRVKFRHLLLFPAGCAAIAAPALLAGKPLMDILGVYLGQMGVNSSLTFNAPSVYQYIPYGLKVNAGLAAKLGILAAFSLVLALLGFLFLRRAQAGDKALFLSALLLLAGVPFLLPYMHERYFFPADVLALIWAVVFPRRFPQALAIQVSSVMGYLTYFTAHFLLPIPVAGLYFPMGIETTLVLFLLLSTLRTLPKTLEAR